MLVRYKQNYEVEENAMGTACNTNEGKGGMPTEYLRENQKEYITKKATILVAG